MWKRSAESKLTPDLLTNPASFTRGASVLFFQAFNVSLPSPVKHSNGRSTEHTRVSVELTKELFEPSFLIRAKVKITRAAPPCLVLLVVPREIPTCQYGRNFKIATRSNNSSDSSRQRGISITKTTIRANMTSVIENNFGFQTLLYKPSFS